MKSVRDERTILLCGMMGSGKTTVGRSLAAALGWSFLDSDTLIEERVGRAIAQIFSTHGEACFRKLESEVLAELPRQKTVIALGGGAVLDATNRERVHETGTVVWLDASAQAILERVGAAEDRPLLRGLDADARLEKLTRLLEERRDAYSQAADARVDTDGLGTAEVRVLIQEQLAAEELS